MPELLQLAAVRAAAFELHNRMDWSNHPCSKGCGKCCEGATPVNGYDEKIIQDAYSRGGIKIKTMKAAQRRVENGTAACGFLNERRECTIYEYRPGICAATGAGGVCSAVYPETKKAVENMLATGVNEKIPAAKLVTSMCLDCAAEMGRRGATFSAETVAVYSRVLQYYGALAQANPINTLIQNFRTR